MKSGSSSVSPLPFRSMAERGLMRFYTREWKEGKLDAEAQRELGRAIDGHVERLQPSLPPALTFLTAGGGVFGLHDAYLLGLAGDAGQLVLRLRSFEYRKDSEQVELTITYARARLMGITNEEREEILDPDGRTHDWDGRGGIPAGEASIMASELDAWADGRFVHRFSLHWPWYEEFAIEFEDAAVVMKARSGRLLDLGQPEDALAAVEESIAQSRQPVCGPGPNPGLAWGLNVLSSRLAGLGRHEEALAASEEAVGLYRQLVSTRPEINRDLVVSLNNLSHRLADLGRPEEALAASDEAAALVE
jgi:tetratricopeptide (TPR) repeat protein